MRISAAILDGSPFDADTYPQRVCDASAALLGMAGTALTLAPQRGIGASWASNGLAKQLEDAQLILGEGPALDALQQHAPVLEPDLASPQARWPFFREAAVNMGIGAAFAFPLQVGAINLGVLTLYRGRAGFLSPRELADALAFAEVSTQDFLDLTAEGGLPWAVRDPRGQHAHVHQATGMISAQINGSMSDALARLRAYAYSNETSIDDAAMEVVNRRLRFD